MFAAASEPARIFVAGTRLGAKGTSLAQSPCMPTATRTSTQQKDSHDATRPSRPAPDEVAVRSPLTSQPEPLELTEADPYDLPCTD
jgi:hypothetical protein